MDFFYIQSVTRRGLPNDFSFDGNSRSRSNNALKLSLNIIG